MSHYSSLMGKIKVELYTQKNSLGSALHFIDIGEFSFQKTFNKLVQFMKALNAQLKIVGYLACSVDFIVQIASAFGSPQQII